MSSWADDMASSSLGRDRNDYLSSTPPSSVGSPLNVQSQRRYRDNGGGGGGSNGGSSRRRGDVDLSRSHSRFGDDGGHGSGGAADDEAPADWREMVRGAVTGKNLLLQLSLVVVMTAEILMRKVNTAVYMKNYRTFLNIVVVAGCALTFFCIVWFKMYVRKNLDHSLTARLFKWYLAISVFDTIATYMIILSQTYVSAPLATLLSQGVIPMTIIASIMFLGKQFDRLHYVGASIIIAGIACSVGASWKSDDDNKFGWAIVFFLSNVPITLGSILKEKIMSDPHAPAEMNALNAWVALIQVFLSLGLSPAGFLLQAPDNSHVHVSDLPRNFANGLDCWFYGSNTSDIHMSSDHCSQAVWAVWVHIALVVVLNILVLAVIFYGSAVMFFIAGAVVIPVTALVSTGSFLPSKLQVSFTFVDVLATVLTLVGLIIYRLKPEDQGPPPDEGELENPLL
eukprot:TRINITY_DN67760_c5_g1_i2.p1 TRINITY_DN67760_c5_g1~~TRINITY_DN67760_c5_g1_i2.p1  ORF type:complete len:453 (-),score=217.71 TRINITY_DN67760_c5_g1_i2:394-1752(-)